jgi:methylthioribulose-1-phosphate dehydratase
MTDELSLGGGLRGRAEELCRVAGRFAERGWVPATSGNFSFCVREGGRERVFVTGSGLDKGDLRPDELLEVRFGGANGREYAVVTGSGKPSAETSLHGVIYRVRPGAGAIVHGHSIWNTLLSGKFAGDGALVLEGYELLKALSGVRTHAHREVVPVLGNTQDYAEMGERLGEALVAHPDAHGVLLERHGLYTWGQTMADAWRQAEALEFLFEVEGRRMGFSI